MSSPDNTTRRAHENPLLALLEYGQPGGIEASEWRGQHQLVASQVLPADARGGEAAYVALGFTFGEPVANDPLFRAATLPSGWRREGSDHAMWSHIVDERGFRRVAVFYKAAFYDRAAHMHLVNVGRGTASDALYASEPPTAEGLRLAAMTPAERADFAAELDRMRASIANSPDIYGDRTERLAQLDALLAAEG
jgi:hypothetical protein